MYSLMSYTGSELHEYPVPPTEGIPNDDSGKLTFLYREKDEGVVPPPTPAEGHTEEWCFNIQYDSPIHIHKRRLGTTTPVNTAFNTGYILSLPGEMAFSTRNGTETEDYTIPFSTASFHSEGYLDEYIDPRDVDLEYPMYKIDLRWAVSVPDGYSVLVCDPFFKEDDQYSIVPQVFDVDESFRWISVTLQLHDSGFRIKFGTPIVQLIPFKRDISRLPAVIDRSTPSE